MNPTQEQLDELWEVLEKEYKKDPAYGMMALRLSDYGSGWDKCKKLAENWPTLLDLLDQIDNTKNPRLLLPLLNIPPEVRPHFEDLLTAWYLFNAKYASAGTAEPRVTDPTITSKSYWAHFGV